LREVGPIGGVGSRLQPFLEPENDELIFQSGPIEATSKALIQSNNALIRNAVGIQGIKKGLFFGVANAVQWYANSWK
jgi:hypothetical protein